MSGIALFNNDYPSARAAIDTYYSLEGYLSLLPHLKSWNLGMITLGEGNLPEAERLLRKCLSEERAGPNRDLTIAWIDLGLGACYVTAGDLDKARPHLDACLACSRAHNRNSVVIITLTFLGYMGQLQGDLHHAASIFREAIELARPRRERRFIAWNLYGLAAVALTADDLPQAARLFGAAEALSEMTAGVGPENRHLVARNIAVLRERLDAAALARHWAEGSRLDWEQAVDEALAFAAAVEARAASDMPEAETKTEPGQAT